MSSWWAGYYGSGLALKPDEYEKFIEKYIAVNKDGHTQDVICSMEEDCTLSDINFLKGKYIGTIPERMVTIVDGDDDDDVLKENRHFGLVHIDEDCDGLFFVPFMSHGHLNLEWNDPDGKNQMPRSDVYVLWSEKALDGPGYFQKERAYNSYEDFRQEFMDALAAYLPEDFDWDGRLGSYSYACYA